MSTVHAAQSVVQLAISDPVLFAGLILGIASHLWIAIYLIKNVLPRLRLARRRLFIFMHAEIMYGRQTQ